MKQLAEHATNSFWQGVGLTCKLLLARSWNGLANSFWQGVGPGKLLLARSGGWLGAWLSTPFGKELGRLRVLQTPFGKELVWPGTPFGKEYPF